MKINDQFLTPEKFRFRPKGIMPVSSSSYIQGTPARLPSIYTHLDSGSKKNLIFPSLHNFMILVIPQTNNLDSGTEAQWHRWVMALLATVPCSILSTPHSCAPTNTVLLSPTRRGRGSQVCTQARVLKHLTHGLQTGAALDACTEKNWAKMMGS